MTQVTLGIDRRALDADLRALERKLAELKGGAVPRATARALTRTAERAKTQTVRELARVKALPSRLLRKRVASFKATPRELKAGVWVGLKKHIPIEEVPGARLVTTGKHAGHLKAGRLAVKAFEARMPNGKRGVYVRKLPGVRRTAGRPATSSPNLPIEHPVIRLAPEAQEIVGRAARVAMRDYLPGELRRLFNLELSKLRGG